MITAMNKDNEVLYLELFARVNQDLQKFKINWYDKYFDSINEQLQSSETGGSDYPTEEKDQYHKLLNGQRRALSATQFCELCKSFKNIITELGDEHQVNNLEDYFSIVATLTANFDSNYQILPLEEPKFIIKLNTREISNIDKNCVYAVVGDEMAETIYFEVDRYFDNIDLNDKQIAILVDNGTNKYLVPVSVKDITSVDSKIIFGWSITSEITANASTLEFSVRFYGFDQLSRLNYSLSTLTNKLTVKPSLNYLTGAEGVTTIEDISDRVSNLLKNYDKLGTAAVASPVVYLCSYEGDDIVQLTEKEGEGSTATNKLDVFVAAYTKADNLKYSWKRSSSLTGSYSEIEEDDGDEYLLVTDIKQEDIDKYNVFYIDVDGEKVEITLSEPPAKIDGETEVQYFRKGSRYTLKEPGYYYCTAIASNSLREKALSTSVVEVPAPAIIDFKEDANTDIMLTFDGTIGSGGVKNIKPIHLSDFNIENYADKTGINANYIGTNSITSNDIPTDGIKSSGSYNIIINNRLNNKDAQSEALEINIYNPMELKCNIYQGDNTTPLTTGQNTFNTENTNIKIFIENYDSSSQINYTYDLIGASDTTTKKNVAITDSTTTITLNAGEWYYLEVKASTTLKKVSGEEVDAITSGQYSIYFVPTNT